MKKNIVRIGTLFACLALSTFAASCSKSGAAKEAATRTVIDHDDESVVIPAKVNRAVVVGVWPLPSVITVFLGSPTASSAFRPHRSELQKRDCSENFSRRI